MGTPVKVPGVFLQLASGHARIGHFAVPLGLRLCGRLGPLRNGQQFIAWLGLPCHELAMLGMTTHSNNSFTKSLLSYQVLEVTT